jgi:hypothetical protein
MIPVPRSLESKLKPTQGVAEGTIEKLFAMSQHRFLRYTYIGRPVWGYQVKFRAKLNNSALNVCMQHWQDFSKPTNILWQGL